MSSGGGIDLVVVSVILLVRAIKELNLAHQAAEHAKTVNSIRMKTSTGEIHNVDVVVTDANNRPIGFQKQENGTYKVIADSAGLSAEQLKQQKATVNSIRRRYAYNTVMQELEKQGFQVVEEKKMEKDTVKLVARRWVG